LTIPLHFRNPKPEPAKEHHDTAVLAYTPNPSTISIYTDGLGIDRNTDAAAALNMPNHINHPHQNLGKESSYNDLAAELTAIHLTIEMLEKVTQYTKCIIYTNGQAAIKAVINPGGQSGQSIIRRNPR
jgi:hypothetical protein